MTKVIPDLWAVHDDCGIREVFSSEKRAHDYVRMSGTTLNPCDMWSVRPLEVDPPMPDVPDTAKAWIVTATRDGECLDLTEQSIMEAAEYMNVVLLHKANRLARLPDRMLVSIVAESRGAARAAARALADALVKSTAWPEVLRRDRSLDSSYFVQHGTALFVSDVEDLL